MKHILLLSLALCIAVCTPSAVIRAQAPAPVPGNFYNAGTMDFDESVPSGEYITLTADGRFEHGSVTRTGTGACAVSRYEYHSGTAVVRDSVLVLTATAGRVRSIAPCDLNADYEKNDTGVRTLAWHAGQTVLAAR